MTITQSFEIFLDNLKVDGYEQISLRYHEITKKLNRSFRDIDSDTANCLQVGSYGRYTGIKGISDLDMLYIMPDNLWDKYKNSQSLLLNDVQKALSERYPATEIKVDRLVVDIYFANFKFEVQPVFEVFDGTDITYKYPDTYDHSYKITKPRQEQCAMTEFRQYYGDTHRHLCKMVRAWKNNMGQDMGGLLVDTLTYKFLTSNRDRAIWTYSQYDALCRDFFEFLINEPIKSHYQALGSGQDVKVKKSFHKKAQKAYEIAIDAFEESDEQKRNYKWRKLFGRSFPKAEKPVTGGKTLSSSSYKDPEQFIEDYYPVDIHYSVSIDCEIQRNGFREMMLSVLLSQKKPICRVRSLLFQITKTDVPKPYAVKWKVRNVGEVAIQRNCLRGEIYDSNKNGNMRKESSDFYGPHYVECYVIKHGVVVARERIEVPIE